MASTQCLVAPKDQDETGVCPQEACHLVRDLRLFRNLLIFLLKVILSLPFLPTPPTWPEVSPSPVCLPRPQHHLKLLPGRRPSDVPWAQLGTQACPWAALVPAPAKAPHGHMVPLLSADTGQSGFFGG